MALHRPAGSRVATRPPQCVSEHDRTTAPYDQLVLVAAWESEWRDQRGASGAIRRQR